MLCGRRVVIEIRDYFNPIVNLLHRTCIKRGVLSIKEYSVESEDIRIK